MLGSGVSIHVRPFKVYSETQLTAYNRLTANGHSDVTPNKAQSNKDANQDSKPQTPVASSLAPREASPTIHETSTSVTGHELQE